MSEFVKLVVGLGNPGSRYALTRHNLGEILVRGLAERHSISLNQELRFKGLCGKGRVGDHPVHLLIPTTFMNQSGQAVRAYLDYFKLSESSLLVVSDDSSLPFGDYRIREKGSAGGHNGLKNIGAHLGTEHYLRLRAGIGAPPQGVPLENYVLQTFSKDEQTALASVCREGVKILDELLCEEVASVMNRVNRKGAGKSQNMKSSTDTGDQLDGNK